MEEGVRIELEKWLYGTIGVCCSFACACYCSEINRYSNVVCYHLIYNIECRVCDVCA